MSESQPTLLSQRLEELDRQIATAVDDLVGRLQEQFGDRVRTASDELLRSLESLRPDLPARFFEEKILDLPEPQPDAEPQVAAASSVGAVYSAVARIDGETGQGDLLNALVDEGNQFADRTAFFLIRGERVRCWSSAGFDDDSKLNGSELSVSNAPWARFVEGRGAMALDAHERVDLAARIESGVPHSAILLPFVVRGQLAGAFYAEQSKDGALGVQELQLLTHCAAQSLETSAVHPGTSPALLTLDMVDDGNAAESAGEESVAADDAETPANQGISSAASIAAGLGVAGAAAAAATMAAKAVAAEQESTAEEAESSEPEAEESESTQAATAVDHEEQPAEAGDAEEEFEAASEVATEAETVTLEAMDEPAEIAVLDEESTAEEAAPTFETTPEPVSAAAPEEALAEEAAAEEGAAEEGAAEEAEVTAEIAVHQPELEESASQESAEQPAVEEPPAVEPPAVEPPATEPVASEFSTAGPADQIPALGFEDAAAPAPEVPDVELAEARLDVTTLGFEGAKADAPEVPDVELAEARLDVTTLGFEGAKADAPEVPNVEIAEPRLDVTTLGFEGAKAPTPEAPEMATVKPSEPATEPAIQDPFETSNDIQYAPSPEDIAQEVEPEPELEDTNIWELEEDDEDDEEPTQVGRAQAEVAEQAAEAVPVEAVGQQTVRLDIAALQNQANQPPPVTSDAGDDAGDDTADVPSWQVEPAAESVVDEDSEEPTLMTSAPPSPAGFAAPPTSFAEPAPTSFAEPPPPVSSPPPTSFAPPEPEPPAPVVSPPAASGSAEVSPPTDLQGPGLAFAKTPEPEAPTAEDSLHEEARRLARLLVSEIKLYNEEIIEEGRRKGNIYERLKDDIDRSRQMYEERIDPRLADQEDYFHQELVQRLAGGDESLLGM